MSDRAVVIWGAIVCGNVWAANIVTPRPVIASCFAAIWIAYACFAAWGYRR